jgi:hypothetical protein
LQVVVAGQHPCGDERGLARDRDAAGFEQHEQDERWIPELYARLRIDASATRSRLAADGGMVV